MARWQEKTKDLANNPRCWLAIFVLLVVGFGASEAHLWNNRHDVVDQDVTCPIVPSLDGVLAAKSYSSQWRWKYEDETFEIILENRCPQWLDQYGPSRVKYKGDLFASSSCDAWTCTFMDCHGTPVYVMKFADTLWDLFSVRTTKARMAISQVPTAQIDADAAEFDSSNVVAYSNDDKLFGDDMTIRDVAGNAVVKMARGSSWTLSKKWNITMLSGNKANQTSATRGPQDPLLLSLIAANKAFRHNGGDYSGSVCNQYFEAVAILFVIFGVVLFLAIGYFCYLCFKAAKLRVRA
mmetsp:Transcript_10304/g.19474  ORF Transcript_10304/g.19474 Transcript_10304/m.19474 type:complete len:294 (+) Transcript_10304:37-918(+)